MNAFALGFHEEEQVIARARVCLDAQDRDCVLRGEFALLLGEYEKLLRQSMRLVRMGDRMHQQLADLNAALRRKQEDLTRLAATDMLTGLCNRRAFMEAAQQALSRARRQGAPLSLLLIDADEFKRVNDTHGHAVGDEVLRRIARTARETLRAEDVVARIGGEEFTALLPDAGPEQAAQAAERLRAAMERSRPAPGETAVACTLSIGVACLEPPPAAVPDVSPDALPDGVEALLRAADEALYAAKAGGRNRVFLAPGR